MKIVILKWHVEVDGRVQNCKVSSYEMDSLVYMHWSLLTHIDNYTGADPGILVRGGGRDSEA